MAVRKERLSQPSAGHGKVLFQDWLKRRHGVHTFHVTQVITGDDYFGMFVFWTRRDETRGYYHCVDCPEDTLEHTVEVCPARAHLSRPADRSPV